MRKILFALLMLIPSLTTFSETITVAQALEIGRSLSSGATSSESYTIEGYVNTIANNDFNSNYNNMTFWIADSRGSLSSNAEGAFYVYRGRPSVELQQGDKISVTDYIKNYNGNTIETATANTPVTLLESVSERTITYGALRVCAQNLANYYIHPNTGRGNLTETQLNAKTANIVNMMLTVDADIYAFCEVEAKPEVLQYLASAANDRVSGTPYTAVSDGIDEDWDATYNNNIKSGFIYRSDRVQPVGSNTAASSTNYYRNTMRYQAFKQLSNNETFVLSMNHFKAKDSSTDQGESTRLSNATSLINALSYVTTDPDILILGDLNCTYAESPVTYIVNAGYTEQLLRFNDSSVYSHCYNGGELIDHALANSTMADQIVDAYVKHLSTTCSVGVTDEMSYSDHDPYVIEINLSSGAVGPTSMTCAAAAEAAMSVSTNNELYNNGAEYTVRGYVTRIQTAYNSANGNISFWMADTENGGSVLEAYRCAVSEDAIPAVGDFVAVTGQLTRYNTTPEFAAGCTCRIISRAAPAVNLGAKSIADFLSIKSAKDTCVLTGVVNNIENTTYGNFYLTDATGTLYIYGLLTADGIAQQFASMDIAEGDTLTLKACYGEYNGSPQTANAVYVSHSKSVPQISGPVTVKLDPESTDQYGWSQVGLWAWVTNGSVETNLFDSWPGVAVSKDAETGWWSYMLENIPEGELHIIWNNFGGDYQTNNIDGVEGNMCYMLTGYDRSHMIVECPSPSDTLNLQDLTVAQATVLGNQQDVNVASSYNVSVTGYVISAEAYDQTFGNQTFLIADDISGSESIKAYRATPMKDGMPYPVLAGDRVMITGPIEHYINNNTGEDFVELFQPTVIFLEEVSGDRSLPAITEIGVGEALQTGSNLEAGYRTNAVYDIVGYVSYIEEDALDTYGNMTFWISNASDGAASNAEGGFYVYRGIADRHLQTGDQVRVRTYVRHTLLADNSSIIQAAYYATVSYLGHPMGDVTYTKVCPILLDDATKSAWQDKIQYDFTYNGNDVNLYIWDMTYGAGTASGLNFYGNADGYLSLVVGNQGWSGAGYSLTGNSLAAAELLRQDIVAHPEDYYLHMAIKSTDHYSHAFYLFNGAWGSEFVLGDHNVYEGTVLQDFRRNGEWQEIYVPLKDYASAFANTSMTNNANIFAMLSEGVEGAQLDLDAVFICKITHPEDLIPTEADLIEAGYNTTNNVVLAFKFDVAPCYDVVLAGNYNDWITDPAQLVHMEPLSGFDGWYVAELPYFEGIQAKPIQLSDIGAFSWDNQAGNSWIYKGGHEAGIESGYAGEVNISYYSAGAYIYEIEYWKNGNNPCEQTTGTYTVLFNAPEGAPESVEVIGSFDNWTGTAMSYNARSGLWEATITATVSDEFKFRQAGTWDIEIQTYNSEYDAWYAIGNLTIRDYLLGSSVVYVDFSDASQYGWSQPNLSYLYVPYNLQAVSEPGKVVFTWNADEISEEYHLHVYDVSDDYYYGYLTVYGGTSYTYYVQDFLDDREVRWSLEPVAPYSLWEVYANSSIIMQKSPVELSNFVLTTTDSVTIDLTWESNTEGLQYQVEIIRNGGLLYYETINTTEFHFSANIPGVVDVYVTPYYADGEMAGRYSYAGSINLSGVPAPFYNLQGSAEEHTLNLTWEGAADSVYVQIFRMEDGYFSNIIYEGVVSGHSLSYTVEEDGNYALQLRAWSELSPGEYGAGPYADYVIVQAFTVSTYSVQIEAGEGGYVWPYGISGNYPAGYVLTVEAYAYDGYVFTGWSDGESENVRTITVSGEISITAQFEPESIATGIEDALDTQTAKKIFKNGNVYIIRGGKTYTMQGQEVR